MQLTNCYPPERILSDGYDASDYELCRRLRIALCCHFYLAYAIRQGMPRSHVLEEESQIRADVHGCFARLSVVDVKRSFRSRCDVCTVLELVERLAKSQFAQGSREFILQTRNNESERAQYDWVSAFREYEVKAQLGRDSRLGVIASRAIAVMMTIQGIIPLSFQAVTEQDEPAVSSMTEIDAMSVSDLMHLVHNQIKVMGRKHLRVVE